MCDRSSCGEIIMTKKLVAIFALLALFATACGGTDETSTADDTPSQESTTTEADVEEAPTTTEAEVEEATTTTEAEAAEAATVNGQEIYESNCARCHGADGIGTRGPDLIDINTNVPDMQVAIDQVINGGGGMPSFGNSLSAEEIQATVDYVYATF